MKIFVDDTKLLGEVYDEVKAQSLHRDLDEITNWSNTWLIKLNKEKCKVKITPKILDGDVELNETDCEKDLGVFLSKDLKWATQCNNISAKANSMLGMLKKGKDV